MSLGINNNISGLSANRFTLQANKKTQLSLAKLSSGLKVNTAQDGPAALVISELLRSQASGISQATRNTQEAYNTLSIAEGGLQEVSSMLTKMRELALSSMNSGVTSSSQTSANQAELNGMLSSVSHIVSTTNYAGENLLNGSQGINFNIDDADNIINSGASSIYESADIAGQSVNVDYSGSTADQAEKAYVESNLNGGTTISEDMAFTVSGASGQKNFEFASGTDIAEIANTINNSSESTGVTAYAIKGSTELRLVSNEYGSDQSVQVEQQSGDMFAPAGDIVRDEGQDAKITVDGQKISTSGLEAEIETTNISGTLQFNEGTTADTTIAQTGYDQDTLTDAATVRNAEFGDISGGMKFQLGEGASVGNRTNFGINSFNTANIGRVEVAGESYSLSDLMSGGSASLANNPEAAIQVIDQAISDVASQRARIGAYQSNTLQTNINSLNVAFENITATESSIRDTDFATEMTNFIKNQVLEKAGLMGIQSANTNAANIMKLLGGE